MVEVKICGLTLEADVEGVVASGAAYAGVIFAGGPRLLSPARARAVLAPTVGTSVKRVGVFGRDDPARILDVAAEASVDVIQLTDSDGPDTVLRLRSAFAGELWVVAHTRPGAARSERAADRWFAAGASAVVLDAAVDGRLGGTGVALDWVAVAPEVSRLRALGRVVLAGGLRPENVAAAVAAAQPDVVDVSSGVERSPGVKDPERLRAFVSAARAHEVR